VHKVREFFFIFFMFAIYIKKTESLNEKLKILGWRSTYCIIFFFNDGTISQKKEYMTKTYESTIVQEYHILLSYTQHIKYIFKNPISFYSQGTFTIYVKVHEINFYTETLMNVRILRF